MNVAESRRILAEHLLRYRAMPYEQLVAHLNKVDTAEVARDPEGFWQLEFQVFWDDRPGGNVRCVGAIDDGGERAYNPETDSFIKAPDGAFVGE